jgi:hypothetical protein
MRRCKQHQHRIDENIEKEQLAEHLPMVQHSPET